jgi:L-arabinose isomerase
MGRIIVRCFVILSVYHAVYLEQLTSQELVNKVSELIKIEAYMIHQVFIQGPSSIHILLSDEVKSDTCAKASFWLSIFIPNAQIFMRGLPPPEKKIL